VSLLTKVIWLPAGTVTFLGLTPLDVIVITIVPVVELDGPDGALLLVPDPPPHAGTTTSVAVSNRTARCDDMNSIGTSWP
jgi:hypothetical protein